MIRGRAERPLERWLNFSFADPRNSNCASRTYIVICYSPLQGKLRNIRRPGRGSPVSWSTSSNLFGRAITSMFSERILASVYLHG